MLASITTPIGRLLHIVAVSLLLFAGTFVHAQVISATTYPFTAGTGVALEDMSSGTTTLVGSSIDDTTSPATNIGFDFFHNGVRAAQFSANANGLLRLGGTAITGNAFNNGAEFAATTNAPKVAAYFEDLCTGSNGRVHSRVVGAAPNRKLVVEWLNMQVSRGAGCAGTGNGTFQVWLSESTGAIQFVYGALPAPAAADAGYSIGTQAGAATNFASITAATATVSYAAAANAQATPIAATTSFALTPPVPTAPTGLNFTAVGPTGLTLNWTDNAGNEVGYAIYRSDDGGATYSFASQVAANATSSTQSGLTPSTSYGWRVFALTEGALSATAASGTQGTAAPGNVTSITSGNWSNPATWSTNAVPTLGDAVTIADTHTVTIDVAASALLVNVGQGASGVLQYEAGTARTLTVLQNVIIAGGGTFQSAATGTVTTHVLSLTGTLANFGTLDFSTNADTAGAAIAFTGTANAALTGNGATTDIRAITVAKTPLATTVTLAPTNFTVRGVATDSAGFLTLTSGTFQIAGSFAGTNRVFTTATYVIPVGAGIWLDNPNYVIAGQAGGTTSANNGVLRVSRGTYGIGVGAADGLGGGAGAQFIIEGGNVTSAGRIDPQAAVTWNQNGGNVTVGTVGNTRSNFGTFELFSTTSVFNFTAGTINIVTPHAGATRVDFQVRSTNFTLGGLLTFGAPPAAAGTYTVIAGLLPTVVVNPAMTLNVNNAPVFFRGTSINNQGAIVSTGAGRLDFAGTAPMLYGGPGTLGTAAAPFNAISANSVALATLQSPAVVNRVNLFQGGFINSNQITLGNGGTSTTVVQVGSAGLTTAGGSFDVSPVHNQGTGGQIALYAFEAATRTTGVEINPTRTLFSMTVDNPNHLTIAGGDLTLTQPAVALTMSNGRVITGSNTLILANPTATVTRTNGFVDGNLRKNFAAAGAKNFEVGSANGFSPVAVNVTAGTFPADVTARAVQGPLPGISPAGTALQRYWQVTATGLTADLTFTYLDPADIPGTATEANFNVYRRDGATLTNLGGVIAPAANTGSVTAITTFGDFTLAEPGGVINFAPTIAAVPVARQAGDAVAASAIIANVSDTEDAEASLTITVDGLASNTSNGVMVSSISSDAAGAVSASILAACGATDANFTLAVTDSGGLSSQTALTVTVAANTGPTLTYPASTPVAFGDAATVNPASGPTDNGAVSTIVVQSSGTFAGTSGVNAAGVVSLSQAAPAGTHTLVIRATDNCGATTDANVSVTVAQAATTTTITSDQPDPSNLAQNVVVQYTVVAQAPASGTPTGNVTVGDGVDSCTGTVAAGQCTLAFSTAGNRTLTATYAGDANYLTSSDTEAHTVNNGTDLGITKTSNLSQASAGLVQYTVIATNLGPQAVIGATVTDILPDLITAATWTCNGAGGGTCGAPSGSGDILETVNLPIGGSVTFAISGTIPINPPPGFFTNTATVSSSASVPDTNPANDSATVIDAVSLFRNGFEEPVTMKAALPALDALDVQAAAVDGAARDVALYDIGGELMLVSARRLGGVVQVSVTRRDATGTWQAGPWTAAE